MVTADVDFVVGRSDIDSAEAALVKADFASQKFPWSITFQQKISTSIFRPEASRPMCTGF